MGADRIEDREKRKRQKDNLKRRRARETTPALEFSGSSPAL